MSNIVTKTFYDNGSWTCPAGVTEVTVIPGISKNNIKKCYSKNSYFLIDTSGASYAWGDNTQGCLGTGNVSNPASSPTLVVGGYTFREIQNSSGPLGTSNFSTALAQDGTCYSWGYNNKGQLGVGDIASRSSPTLVLGGYKFQSIAQGGPDFRLALTSDGTCYSWGYNPYCVLGVGNNTNRSSPTLVIGGYKFQKIVSSSSSCLGLSTEGTLYAWGYNFYGQLGLGDTATRSSPTLVLGNLIFKDISMSIKNSYGLALDGTCYSWGDNTCGQLGDGTTIPASSPVLVLGGLKFSQFLAGYFYNNGGVVFGISGGNLYSWGANQHGALGVGDTISRSSPTLVIGGYKFKKIYTNLILEDCSYTLALSESGSCYSWGTNYDGELGLGDIASRSSPTLVLGNHIFKNIYTASASDDFAFERPLNFGTTFGGAIYVWGYNATNGTDGSGSTASHSSPTLVVGGNIINTAPDNSYTNIYQVIPGTSYNINLNSVPTFGSNIISPSELESVTLEYEA